MRGMKCCIDIGFLKWKSYAIIEYELLNLFPEPKTSNEEEDKGDTNGTGPSGTRVVKELGNLRGGKDSLEREVAEQTLEQEGFIM
jgi:hypothetical protein